MDKIVKTFDDFKSASKAWKPNLTMVTTIQEAADYINFPHEDYPDFVDQTLSAIKITIDWLKHEKYLTERHIKQLHKICMEGKHIELGKYRIGEVAIHNMKGDIELIPPQPYLIPQMMMSIMPVGVEYQKTDEDIINWYKEFETIHPFVDGNGRVGGVVLAAFSYVLSGNFIVNDKEYHHTLNRIIIRITNKYDKILNDERFFDLDKSYDERVIEYLLMKLKTPKTSVDWKFKSILRETDKLDELQKLINDSDVENIIYLLKDINNDPFLI